MGTPALWFVLISHLETYLAAKTGAAVSQGFARGETYPAICPAIRLYRRGEPDLDIWTRPKGTLEVTAEIWIKNEDPNPKKGNEALAVLEESARQALIAWAPQVAADLKIKIVDMSFAGVAGDGENYRPHAMAVYGLLIKWAK